MDNCTMHTLILLSIWTRNKCFLGHVRAIALPLHHQMLDETIRPCLVLRFPLPIKWVIAVIFGTWSSWIAFSPSKFLRILARRTNKVVEGKQYVWEVAQPFQIGCRETLPSPDLYSSVTEIQKEKSYTEICVAGPKPFRKRNGWNYKIGFEAFAPWASRTRTLLLCSNPCASMLIM